MNSLKIIIIVVSTGFIIACDGGFDSTGQKTTTTSSETSTPALPGPSPTNPVPSPLPPVDEPDAHIPGRGITNLNMFFMGHSLVGPHIPGLVEQLSEAHSIPSSSNSQVGWGTTMRAHYNYYSAGTEFPGLFTGDPNHRDAHEAIASGEFNVLVITEMVEIIHAVKYFNTEDYAGQWSEFTEDNSPGTQVYLYETWPNLDVEGELSGDENHPEYTTGRHGDYWLNKVEFDHNRYWRQSILNVMNGVAVNNTVRMIPAGQVMKEFVILLEGTQGGIGGISNRQSLFSDNIHLSDYGMYLVGLAQISTILDRSPCNLPRNWNKRDGSAQAPSPALANAMQSVVKRVLADYREVTGVTFSNASCP